MCFVCYVQLIIANYKKFYQSFRLEAYDRNANFSDDPLIPEVWQMTLPEPAAYRDVTGNSSLPPMSLEHIKHYLMPLGTTLDKTAEKLYNDR